MLRTDILKLKETLRRFKEDTKMTDVEFHEASGISTATITAYLDISQTAIDSFNPRLRTLYDWTRTCDRTLGDLFSFLLPESDVTLTKLINEGLSDKELGQMTRSWITFLHARFGDK